MSMYVEVGYRQPYVNVCRGGLQTTKTRWKKNQKAALCADEIIVNVILPTVVVVWLLPQQQDLT